MGVRFMGVNPFRSALRFGLLLNVALLVAPVWAQQAPPAAAAPAAAAEEALDCNSCHEQSAKVSASAHASVQCAQCHANIKEFPHPEKAAKPECGACHAAIVEDYRTSVHGVELAKGNAAPDCAMCHGAAHEVVASRTAEHRKASPESCGMCHADALAAYQDSVHGKAVAKDILAAAVCTDCHGEHNIRRHGDAQSQARVGRQRETCGRCHGDVRLASRFGIPADRLLSFDQSFHGLALKSGSQTVADCASCHGYHDILPSSNPRSMIHPTKLPETCGKCHPGAGSRFPITTIHLSEGGEEPGPVRIARLAYQVIIPLTLGFMFLHHMGDWIRKVFSFRLQRPADEKERKKLLKAGADLLGQRTIETYRMYPMERFQHGLLVLSFTLLVWSGFALRYPDQFWSQPVLAWETTYPIRGIIHRTAGVIMIALSLLHVITIIYSPRLRKHWMELLPHRRDVVTFIENLAWRMFLRKDHPRLPGHSYVEKIEYWAVVWGTAVMGLTGVMLWANRWMLEYLPKVVLDVSRTIHFYEAVLATLAIVVWHFYWVIFDPAVYPMDPAWLTGYSVRKRDEEHHDEAPAAPPLKATADQEKKSDSIGDYGTSPQAGD